MNVLKASRDIIQIGSIWVVMSLDVLVKQERKTPNISSMDWFKGNILQENPINFMGKCMGSGLRWSPKKPSIDIEKGFKGYEIN